MTNNDLTKITDLSQINGDTNCCKECFSPSHDVQQGHITVAIPEGCNDESCPCHCDHDCTSMCRHNGCNCQCGEWHNKPE